MIDLDRPLQRRSRLGAVVMALAMLGCGPSPPAMPDTSGGRTVVMVHGAWAGGWHFRKVAPLLRDAGLRVYRPTLTGLGERVHLARPEVNLSAHVEDVVRVLEFEALEDVVLVGHSYGGMVITGVAESCPERIGLLVYLDALLPQDGESVMDLAGDRVHTTARLGGAGDEPWQLVPLWVGKDEPPPVDVPQPLATFTEPIRLGDPRAAALPAVYILTVEAGATTDLFSPFAQRARDRGWRVVEMEGGHNPHWFQPEALAQVLVATTGSMAKGERQ